ncbi:hypothetical protein FHS21_005073 [Phyllobacterium trifolii]|uniref:Uncharacterized protein n=1 Tax=Phyllobacterium trifolii TaxID=300193 RepID=A0A839UFA9_9HYPH|nr:hypothetical protein [Phyllobacterium trifolii]
MKQCKNIQARVRGTHGVLTDAANLQIGRRCLAPRRPLVAKTVVSKHRLLPAKSRGHSPGQRPFGRRHVARGSPCRMLVPIWVLQIANDSGTDKLWSVSQLAKRVVEPKTSTGQLAYAVYRRFF